MASQIVEEYGDERAAEALQKGIAQGIQHGLQQGLQQGITWRGVSDRNQKPLVKKNFDYESSLQSSRGRFFILENSSVL